jgi:lipopolysaccharide transport system permease protein
LGWILASLHVYLRDTAQVLTVILTFWFWLTPRWCPNLLRTLPTPIFITEQQFPPRLRFLLAGNPLAYLVRAYRELLLSGRWPRLDELGIVAAFAVAMFLAGGLFFRHMKRGFADVL